MAWLAISQPNSSNQINQAAQARISWGAGYGRAAKTICWAARVKSTERMGKSQDHTQLPPDPHGMPQKDALSEAVVKTGSSLHVTFLRRFI